MAEVKDVTLTLGPGSSNLTSKATVHFKTVFTPAEAGKTFHYRVELYGEDKAGDDEASFPVLGTLLQTFLFGAFPSLATKKSLTAQAGEQSFTEAREVSTSKLNEDPGVTVIQGPQNTQITLKHADEVYASVCLMADEERSSAVQLIL